MKLQLDKRRFYGIVLEGGEPEALIRSEPGKL